MGGFSSLFIFGIKIKKINDSYYYYNIEFTIVKPNIASAPHFFFKFLSPLFIIMKSKKEGNPSFLFFSQMFRFLVDRPIYKPIHRMRFLHKVLP